MPNIPTLEPEDASKEVTDLYLDFQRRMGFPAAPNFIRTQGHSLASARGTWGLVQNVLVGGVLPRTLKEMMFTAISADRRCRYCEAAHLACCRMLGVDEEALEKLAVDIEGLTPEKTRDLVKFGVKCAREPQNLSAEDFAVLQRHGLSRSEVMEVIAMSALAAYANIIADATGMEPDAMFSQL